MRRRHSLLIKRRFSLFASSFCKTVLWRLRQSYHVRSRFNDTFSSSNIVPISSALFFKARSSVCLLSSSKVNKSISYSGAYVQRINNTRYRRYYRTHTFQNVYFFNEYIIFIITILTSVYIDNLLAPSSKRFVTCSPISVCTFNICYSICHFVGIRINSLHELPKYNINYSNLTYNFNKTSFYRYKRFYSTRIYNKPDNRHVKQLPKNYDNPCHRKVKYGTNLYNKPDNVNVKYQTMQTGELRPYDRNLWLFLNKHIVFEYYIAYYAFSNDLDVSHINGIRKPDEPKFDPLEGYKPRALGFYEDEDDLSIGRSVYKRERIAAEGRRLAGIEYDIQKKRAENKMLIADIKSAASRSTNSVKPSPVILKQLNDLGILLDEKCSVDGLPSSHPMNFIPASEIEKVRLSYLQATIMKSFHALTNEKIYSKKQSDFLAYCSYRENISTRIHTSFSSFRRAPDLYFLNTLIRIISFPTKLNCYSWFTLFLFFVLLGCVYVVIDYNI